MIAPSWNLEKVGGLMSDPITRVYAVLEGRYAIERDLGEGSMPTTRPTT